MKSIPLRDFGKVKSADVIRAMLETAAVNSGGIKIGEMRKRMKILDVLEGSTDALVIEDEYCGLLRSILADFPFAVANKEIVQVADDITEATEPIK